MMTRKPLLVAAMCSLVTLQVSQAMAQEPIAATQFEALLGTLDESSFESARTAVLQTAAGRHRFSCHQLGRILDALHFGSERLGAIRLIVPRLVDLDNHGQLLKHLEFSSERETLLEIVRRVPAVPATKAPDPRGGARPPPPVPATKAPDPHGGARPPPPVPATQAPDRFAGAYWMQGPATKKPTAPVVLYALPGNAALVVVDQTLRADALVQRPGGWRLPDSNLTLRPDAGDRWTLHRGRQVFKRSQDKTLNRFIEGSRRPQTLDRFSNRALETWGAYMCHIRFLRHEQRPVRRSCESSLKSKRRVEAARWIARMLGEVAAELPRVAGDLGKRLADRQREMRRFRADRRRGAPWPAEQDDVIRRALQTALNPGRLKLQRAYFELVQKDACVVGVTLLMPRQVAERTETGRFTQMSHMLFGLDPKLSCGGDPLAENGARVTGDVMGQAELFVDPDGHLVAALLKGYMAADLYLAAGTELSTLTDVHALLREHLGRAAE